MKYLILMLLFASCSNKSAIVDQIKDVKDSLAYAKFQQSGYSLLKSDIQTYGKPETSDKRFLETVPEYVIQNNRIDSAKIYWDIKIVTLNSKIDSLETELKRY